MDTNISHSADVKVGQIFTPLPWAEWLISKFGVFDAWLNGASVCDPTAGQGAFALALFRIALTNGVDITQELLGRLTLIEVRRANLAAFREKAMRDYFVEFPSSGLHVQDVIIGSSIAQYDILIGNPPWSNFTNLPSHYKERLKPYFVAEGLVPDKKRVLLGSSRTDIAALVLKTVLGRMIRTNGFGCFYVPLSLFSGDDAHIGFRDYRTNNRRFAVDEVYEFTTSKVFEGIGTAYCCARFRLDTMQQFPVKYFRESNGLWIEHAAVPLKKPDDQWRVLHKKDELDAGNPIEVTLSAEQKPRQGLNTCGANAVFLFDEKPADLPEEYLFPLATKELWKEPFRVPHKWVLLPYNTNTGRPLSWHQIERTKALRDYLNDAKSVLEKRKGTLIQSAISKGYWWSLLGVGPYSFAPYKVIWQAYGKNDFNPIILDAEDGKAWQGNQAMHAFIPCWSEGDAKRIMKSLQNPAIFTLLKQLNGGGKCNWAQPGKIKKILSFNQQHFRQGTLFPDLDEDIERIKNSCGAEGSRNLRGPGRPRKKK